MRIDTEILQCIAGLCFTEIEVWLSSRSLFAAVVTAILFLGKDEGK